MARTKATKQVETPPTGETPAAQLSIEDIMHCHQIIDVAQKRGAFEAGEMVFIGTVYNKITAFLKEVAPAEDPAKAAEEGADA